MVEKKNLSRAMSTLARRACVVNARRLDFDDAIDFGRVIDALGGDADSLTTHDDASPDVRTIAERAVGHEVIVTKEVTVDVAALPACVRLICEAGTGYNNIDVQAARARGITVTNVPSYSTDAVAQLVITFALCASVSLGEQLAALRVGDRRAFKADFSGLPNMFELRGKTIGLVGGTGAIGKRTAELARALGMNVKVWSRSATTVEGLWEAVTFEDLMATSDFVSVHCPLTAETRGLIDERAISMMKRTSWIINTARGACINESHLIEALKAKRIAGACLDVQETEPPADDSPLYTLDNVYLTPHIGWKRLESRQRLVDTVAENIRAFLSGKPINVVGS